MDMTGQERIDAPVEVVWRALNDPDVLRRCIPGCEALSRQSDDRLAAAVVLKVGPIKARFNLVVEVKEEAPPERVVSVTRGEEGTRASVISSNNELLLAAAETGGTEVKYAAEVSVTGRLGKFGLGMMKKKAESLGAKFAENFRGKIEAAALS